MDKIDTRMETADQIIRHHFGRSADETEKIGRATNNLVYRFTVAGNHYFLKLFRSRNWPENGKLPFVYSSLSRKNIPCAELIAFRRDDEVYPNGYLIESQIQGTAADRVLLDREQETGLYIKLAELVSSIHGIRIKNYGYIGSGTACYTGITDFFADEFERIDIELKDAIPEKLLEKLRETFFNTMQNFEDLPSVLCHSDLSKKNVILRERGEISLIDWDDAMALNWMADVSRLTFWMKLNYSQQEYAWFRKAFLEHYRASCRKSEFDIFESAYHIYTALDFLIFSKKTGDRKTESRLKTVLTAWCQI